MTKWLSTGGGDETNHAEIDDEPVSVKHPKILLHQENTMKQLASPQLGTSSQSGKQSSEGSSQANGESSESELKGTPPLMCTAGCCCNLESQNQPTDRAFLGATGQQVGKNEYRYLNPQWYKEFTWLHVCNERKKLIASWLTRN